MTTSPPSAADAASPDDLPPDADHLTVVTICDTCKFPDGTPTRDGLSGGASFFETTRQAWRALPPQDQARLALRSFSCLMNCDRSCSAAVSAAAGATKTGYVLGDFEPTRDAAEAVLAYALGHQSSATGVVPYKTWPPGVKGKFIARIPGAAPPAAAPKLID